VKPNFDDWDFSDHATKDLYDIMTANIGAEVERSMIVTPGVFDRPIINQYIIGRMFNQFSGFAMAFANQRLRVMAQMPTQYQLGYAMVYFMLGAISDAISNHLSGRRSLDESAELWQTQPLGMSYSAFRRSGLIGWLERPMAVAESLGVPFAPANALAAGEIGSTYTRHMSAQNPLTLLGPVASDIDQGVKLAAQLSKGEFDDKAAYRGWKLAPYQNLLWWRMLHSTTGAPVVPESLIRDRLERQEARP
jgi:hypothetical protein